MRRVLPLMLVCACAPAAPYYARLGSPAPRFAAETINEEWSRMESVDLEQAVKTHQAVVLSFGASYCMPCILEWAVLRDVAADYSRRGLLVIFVVIDRQQEGIDAMRALSTTNLGISSPVVSDPSGELAVRYKVDELPQLYLLDDHGKVVWREVGFKGATMEELTERL